jgi:hypothetical protein
VCTFLCHDLVVGGNTRAGVEATTSIQSQSQHWSECIITKLPYNDSEYPFSLIPGSFNMNKTTDEHMDGRRKKLNSNDLIPNSLTKEPHPQVCVLVAPPQSALYAQRLSGK